MEPAAVKKKQYSPKIRTKPRDAQPESERGHPRGSAPFPGNLPARPRIQDSALRTSHPPRFDNRRYMDTRKNRDRPALDREKAACFPPLTNKIKLRKTIRPSPLKFALRHF